ncbi:MAG: hypothetical protein E6G41_03515 [Actinobacteria bacterium]|nr:MAG: hypothetical protein E6G41_03515 [Actinomycetota bacterium]
MATRPRRLRRARRRAQQSTTLERNTANQNDADGIHVLSRFTTVIRNTADSNALLGIEAVSGITDGGGNRAFGNGNPLQCTNVFCN